MPEFDPMDVLGQPSSPRATDPRATSPPAARTASSPLPRHERAVVAHVERAASAGLGDDLLAEVRRIRKASERTAFYATIVGLPVLALIGFWALLLLVGLAQGLRSGASSPTSSAASENFLEN